MAGHAPLRAVREAGAGPWAAIIAFNVVMIAWHIPALFDLAQRNQYVHIWLMHASFFAAGVWFWIQFIPSPPLHRRLPPSARLAALVMTNVIMWFLAMSLSIFTQTSWYSAYGNVPGVTLPPFADQQIGAAILWVCGDLWCFPAVTFIILGMAADEGGVGAAIEKILGRGSARMDGRPWRGDKCRRAARRSGERSRRAGPDPRLAWPDASSCPAAAILRAGRNGPG